MSYADAIRNACGQLQPLVTPEVKVLRAGQGLRFPVLYTRERERRPYEKYDAVTRANCPLCQQARDGLTNKAVVKRMEWLPATYPIKSLHAIVYPSEHRASIQPEDIATWGSFVDRMGDVAACINLRGSAASLPEHFHAQFHDYALPVPSDSELKPPAAFPLLACVPTVRSQIRELTLASLPTYPAYALLLQGPWLLLGRWIVHYLAASNARPHNFTLAPRGRLYVIPRGLEKAPSYENRFGASEMCGLISLITRHAYLNLEHGSALDEALYVCGVVEPSERLAIEEHALSVMEYVQAGTRRKYGHA